MKAPQVSKPLLIWAEQFKVHSFEADCKGLGTVESVCRHFQEAAWNHAEHLGLGYECLLQENRIWVLARLMVQVHRHLRWGETVTVHTWPRQAKSVFALRDFEMLDSEGARRVSGSSAWLVLDATTRKPQRVDQLISSIAIFPDKRALDQDPEKLEASASNRTATQFLARYSDIDVNGHVNNARYIGWLMDSYPLDFHRTYELKWIEINYLGETKGGDMVSVLSCEPAPGDYRLSLVKSDTGIEVCRAKLLWTPRIGPDCYEITSAVRV
jgi:medium-chain acyl-[acyl-carrier-protein] hydrolase